MRGRGGAKSGKESGERASAARGKSGGGRKRRAESRAAGENGAESGDEKQKNVNIPRIFSEKRQSKLTKLAI